MTNNYSSMLLEEELSYKLRGIFIDISRNYGYLYKEKAYQNILIDKFRMNLINYQATPRVPLLDPNSGSFICNYYPDFVVENKIILEIKAQIQVVDSHINQLIRYLSCTGYEIGFIVNFGAPKVQIIRRIYTNDRKPFFNLNKNKIKD